MEKIKDPVEFLLENGLIFEFNRLVLHPIGLALEVDICDNDEGKTETFLQLWRCPDDDTDGFLYPSESFNVGHQKYSKYMTNLGNQRLKLRSDKLGFVIQEK